MTPATDRPACDVVGCLEPAAIWVDDIPHCWGCFELVWERDQAVEIEPAIREIIEPIRYRWRPTRDFGPLATFDLPPDPDPIEPAPIGPEQIALELGTLEREVGELNP